MSSPRLRIVIGADPSGSATKDRLLTELAYHPRVELVDDASKLVGDQANYAPVAIPVAEAVRDGKYDRAILVCGTGIGMSIAANKVKGIRAALGSDTYSVERSIKSNDAQILCLGELVTGIELAATLANQWLNYDFDPESRSTAKVREICSYEGVDFYEDN